MTAANGAHTDDARLDCSDMDKATDSYVKRIAELSSLNADLLEALKALITNIEAVEYRDKAGLRLGETVPQFEHAKHAHASGANTGRGRG